MSEEIKSLEEIDLVENMKELILKNPDVKINNPNRIFIFNLKDGTLIKFDKIIDRGIIIKNIEIVDEAWLKKEFDKVKRK